MNECAIDVIGKKRTARAAFAPVRAEHEMVCDQLTAAVEQLRQRTAALRTFEHIRLVDEHPGELTPRGTDLIAQVGQFPLFLQKSLARGQPLVAGYDRIVLHRLLRRCVAGPKDVRRAPIPTGLSHSIDAVQGPLSAVRSACGSWPIDP